MKKIYGVETQSPRGCRWILIIILTIVGSCTFKNEEKLLNKKWYVKGMVDLNTGGRTLTVQRCDFLLFKRNNYYHDKQVDSGTWRMDADTLILQRPNESQVKFQIKKIESNSLLLLLIDNDTNVMIEFFERPQFCDWVENN